MGDSGTFLVSLLLLFFGTFVAIAALKGSSERRETANIVPLPRIGGGALKRGPWPGCLGLTADDCVALIETYATDCHVVVITPDTVATDDFDVNRVRVHVDDEGMVTDIPLRGR